MSFQWNGDYGDLEQVAPYMDDYLARYEALAAAGSYPYNDSFKGHIAGIEGEREGTAIYLLQGLRRKREQDAKVAALLAEGYEHIERLDGIERFKRIVLYPTRRMGGEWAEYTDARLIPEDDGRIRGVLPKGKRTHGNLVYGRAVLVLR